MNQGVCVRIADFFSLKPEILNKVQLKFGKCWPKNHKFKHLQSAMQVLSEVRTMSMGWLQWASCKGKGDRVLKADYRYSGITGTAPSQALDLTCFPSSLAPRVWMHEQLRTSPFFALNQWCVPTQSVDTRYQDALPSPSQPELFSSVQKECSTARDRI